MNRLLVLVLLVSGIFLPGAAVADSEPIDVLVYSATYGYRHASIDTANERFAALGETAEFDVDLTTDPARISADGLAPYDVVMFLNATGEHPFSERQRQAFSDFIAHGGGFVGTHASADGNYYWSEYGRVLGAYFFSHPHTGVATNTVEDATSPFVAHLPAAYELREEYYRFQLDPRPNVHVLTSLVEETTGANESLYLDDQPTTWCQEVGRGRSFYTAWGHFDASFENADVWQMLLQGLRWAGGRLDADCTPTEPPPGSRIEAEHADQIAFGRRETSDAVGAAEVVTEILDQGHLRFRDVDLTGVDTLRLRVAPRTMPEPKPYHLPLSTPALGGQVHVRLDAVGDGPRADGCPFTGQCAPGEDIATVAVDPADQSWRTLDVPLGDVAGVHDLYLVFSNDVTGRLSSTRLFLPEATDDAYLMSVDWIELAAGA